MVPLVVRSPQRLAVLGALALTLAAAGCGGSSSSSESSTTTEATTTEAATTGSSGGGSANGRLSAATWATYEAGRAQAQSVNQSATATFRKCRQLVLSSADSSKVKSCLGDSTTSVVTAGQKALSTLQGFQSEASGACSTALTNYEGAVRLYVASVNALGGAVDRGSSAQAQTAIDQSTHALATARTQGAKFEAACKPV